MVDLIKYTGISRKGRIIKFDDRLNEREFPSGEEAEKYEKLYNSLAVGALKEMMFLIKKHNIVSNAKKLNQEELASWAHNYYTHGGICGIRAPTIDSIEKKTNDLYELSKDFKHLKEVGIV